ncbi:MAG: glutamate racemase [Candidatus Coproplasma sp.]
MATRRKCVVVFDSGIGGLNLLYECACRVRDVDYYYVSDSANMPYGNRGREEILSLTLNALKAAEELKPVALVLACNTVTANCISNLRERYSFPVIGVQPAIKSVAGASDNYLILATNATVNSPEFNGLLYKYNASHACVRGCDGLAKYIEDNVFNLPEKLPDGLLPDVKADCVVLGCTHYAFVKKQIESHYGCGVIDGIGGTADHFAKILGTVDHSAPLLGKIRHFGNKVVNITFLGGDFEKNSQIFTKTYINNCLKMSNNFIKFKII